MSPKETDIVADLALRLEEPRRERNAARLAVAAIAALAIDLTVVGLVWFERDTVPLPQATEIPVEIVVEPPPPPPPPPAPAPQAAENHEAMKPADDAPREGKSDHDDENAAEKEKPAAAPPPPAATPSPEASKAEAPPPAPEAPKAADADLPAPQETPQPQAEKAPAAVASLPLTFDSVPDINFGGAAMNSPVTGGKAKSYYTSQLYGLIYARLHVPAVAHAYGRTLTGAVNFAVDGNGRLIQRYVAAASGSTELDEAVMQAIATAAHFFPKPPHGSPVGLSFTYSVN